MRSLFRVLPCSVRPFQLPTRTWGIRGAQNVGNTRGSDDSEPKRIPDVRPRRHEDSRTLFLVVQPNGRSHHRVQRSIVNGKRRALVLGGYPYVGLAEARAIA